MCIYVNICFMNKLIHKYIHVYLYVYTDMNINTHMSIMYTYIWMNQYRIMISIYIIYRYKYEYIYIYKLVPKCTNVCICIYVRRYMHTYACNYRRKHLFVYTHTASWLMLPLNQFLIYKYIHIYTYLYLYTNVYI
jgi:hypothetical protein